MTATPHKRGIVLSDTHFLGNYWQHCDARSPAEISSLCQGKDIAVLNGDIFDYHYSGMRPDAWIKEASSIMRGWLKHNTKCEFRYVIGNHDDWEPWLQALDKIAAEFPGKLKTYTEEYRTPNAIFLHGDYAYNPSVREGNRRVENWAAMAEKFRQEGKERPQMTFSGTGDEHKNLLSELVDSLAADGKLDGAAHVFSGHFHGPAINVLVQPHGVRYHNTGSPTVGASFMPLLFDMDGRNAVSNVRPALPLAITPNHNGRQL